MQGLWPPQAGRICASTATGVEMVHLPTLDPLDRPTDDHIRRRTVVCRSLPGSPPWGCNRGDGVVHPRVSASKPTDKTSRAERRVVPVNPNVLMLSLAEYRARHQAPRVHRAPGAPRALFMERAEGMRKTRAQKRRGNELVCCLTG